MKFAARLRGLVPIAVLAVAALAAGGSVGAALGGVAALAAVLAGVAYVGALPARRARARRYLPEGPVEAGQDVLVRVDVDFPRLWPLCVLSLRDASATALGQGLPEERVLSGSRRSLSASYTLHGVPRGLHPFGPISLEAGDALSLSRHAFLVPCAGELLVHPARVSLKAPPPQGGRDALDLLPRGTRDFQPGDAPTRLHAARTAQRGFPQVREFDAAGGTPYVLTLYAKECDAADLELLLSCAASLASAFIAAGDTVGLKFAGAPAHGVTPERGPEQGLRLLAALSTVAGADLVAARAPRATAGADCWLLTTDAQAQFAGRILRVGAAAGQGALTRLQDLSAHLERGAL